MHMSSVINLYAAYQRQTCLKDQDHGHDLPIMMYVVFLFGRQRHM